MEPDVPEARPEQILHIELPLREDIGAELNDFLTLGLLGIDGEARDLAQSVLWRHLRQFPVFAEVADYTIDKNDNVLQEQLLATIRGQAVQYDRAEEQLFLDTVIEILNQKKSLSISWSETKYQMLEFRQWSSIILCQRLQVLLTFIVRHVSVLNDVENRYILSTVREFVDRGMISDAARLFKILATSAQRFIRNTTVDFIRDNMQETFSKLVNSLEVTEKGGSIDEIRQMQGDVLLASIAFLRLLKTHKDGKPVYEAAHFAIDQILLKTQQLLATAFGTLLDTRPRGQHLDFCEKLQKELDDVKAAPSANVEAERSSAPAPLGSDMGTTQDRSRMDTADVRTAPPTEYYISDTASLGSRHESVAPILNATAYSTPQRRMISESKVSESPRGFAFVAGTPFSTNTSSNAHDQRGMPIVNLKAGRGPPGPQRRTRSDYQVDNSAARLTPQGRHAQASVYDHTTSKEASANNFGRSRLGDSVTQKIQRDYILPRTAERFFHSDYAAPTNEVIVKTTSVNKIMREDPLEGFSVAAKVLLDKNAVSGTFLEQSAAYLKNNPRLVREEDVSVWRERARFALRAGDAELARKLIQQACLIELSQRYKPDGVDRFLQQDTAFETFIKKSYTTYLLYLNRLENEDALRKRRRDMLIPWAKFMYWTFEEDILETLSLPPDSMSADWAASASFESKQLQPLSRPAQSQVPRGSSTVGIVRGEPIDPDSDFNASPTRRNIGAVPPGSSQQSKDSQSLSYRDYSRDSTIFRGQAERRDYEDAAKEHPYRLGKRPVEQTIVRDEEEEEDDDDDTDEHFEGAQSRRDSRVARSYILPTHYATAPAHNQARCMPSSVDTPRLETQSVSPREPRQKFDTFSPRPERPIDTASSASARPQDTTQPANPITRLSRGLIGFVGQKTYRDCLDYYEDNPKLSKEDVDSFQSVVMDLLRQGRNEAAERVTERWLMLREASSSSLGGREWMKRLPAVPARQDTLRQPRDTVLRAMEKKFDTEPSSFTATAAAVAALRSTAPPATDTSRTFRPMTSPESRRTVPDVKKLSRRSKTTVAEDETRRDRIPERPNPPRR